MKDFKKQVVTTLILQIEDELNKAIEAANTTKDGATSSEMKQEEKYDTRQIEASYLAGAQEKRVQELTADLNLVKTMEVKRHERIQIGSLISLKSDSGEKLTYLIVPSSGGASLKVHETSIQTISVQTMLAQEALDLEVGDSFEVETPSETKEFEILNIE